MHRHKFGAPASGWCSRYPKSGDLEYLGLAFGPKYVHDMHHPYNLITGAQVPLDFFEFGMEQELTMPARHRYFSATCARIMRILLMALFALSGLVACQVSRVDDEHSHYFTIPSGTRLLLHTRLTIPARKWSVYFQQGEATSFGKVDEYLPYCQLEVSGPQEQEQNIEPGTFEVTDVRDEVNSVLSAPVSVAYSGHRMAGVFERQFARYETVMYLRATDQPHITQLRCSRIDETPVGTFVSVFEIRQALGDVLTMVLPTA